jgi:hypothetical protein
MIAAYATDNITENYMKINNLIPENYAGVCQKGIVDCDIYAYNFDNRHHHNVLFDELM